MKIHIKIPKKPHEAQNEVITNAKRFNVISNGRRWGKTVLAEDLLIRPALEGFPVAYFAPTYKDLAEVWQNIKYTLMPAIRSKNETTKQIILITGGVIDFWSMENPSSGRGRHYKRVVVDEAAKANKLEEAWKQTIRPTLADLRGDAYIFSTPKGIYHFFYEMFGYAQKFDNWSSFQLPTSTNPFISHEEIEEVRLQLDDYTFRQEFLAEFLDFTAVPFMYAFEEVSHTKSDLFINKNLPLWLSFDFNVDSMSCVVAQKIANNKCVVIDEVLISNANTEMLCNKIKLKYKGNYFIVTGDASGKKGDTRSNVNDYVIISKMLGVAQNNMRIRKANLGLSDSQTLCNSMLAQDSIFVSKTCKGLIKDLKMGAFKKTGKELQKDRASFKLDLFDCFRYLVDAMYPNFSQFIKQPLANTQVLEET